VPEPNFVDPPALEESRIFLVHRPGSVQSSIQIGHVAVQPDNPDYYPLQVLNKVVGSGTDSRLFLILREQHGWTYSPASSLSRPEDVGYFSASAEVRNEVTDSAVVEILAQLRRIREEPVPLEELEAAKSFLTGSFPLRIETPGSVARQLAQVRLLGLPIEALTEYRDRVAAVTSADIQRVAREYIRPEHAAIVVVGDATQVLEQLEGIAPITLTDIEGNPIAPSDLQVTSSGVSFDASGLQPMTLEYRILFQGNPFGTATTNLVREGDSWTASTRVQAGPTAQSSEVRFTDDFTPISLSSSVSQGGTELGSELELTNERVTGTVRLPEQMGGERQIDTEVPEGTLLSGMDAFALATADLSVGDTIAIPLFTEQSGSVVQATFRVTGEESVTVPAGTFDTYRLEMSAGPQNGTLWVRREAPHLTLRQEFEGQPVVIELEEGA
jgi:zinc protease